MTPDFMQKIGHFTFNYWAVNEIKKIILYQQSLEGVRTEIAVLSAVCVIFLLLADEVFKVE